MSRRFKPSKYKNAAPKSSTHSAWIRDLSVASYNCFGNFISASAAFTAFNINPTGSQLGVVALDAEGPVTGANVSVLNAHSDLVTDMDWSPFEDGLLATGSADSTVKVWSVNLDNLSSLSLLSPEAAVASAARRVETVTFHPTAAHLLSYTSQNVFSLWDILANKELLSDDKIHGDKIMSMSWSLGGELVGTAAKDKLVRILDPRTSEVVANAPNHTNDKDCRLLWLGDSPYVLSSGFDSARRRQLFIRDIRDFSTPLKSLEFDSSPSLLLPLHDPDSNMIFLGGRGESSVGAFEFDASAPDLLLEGYRYSGSEGQSLRGLCLVPKRGLRVMETEVNRVLCLTPSSVVVLPWHVPRKSYVNFAGDLFPPTRGTETSGSPGAWMDGEPGLVSRVELNPAVAPQGPYYLGDGSLRVFKPSLADRRAQAEAEAGAGIYKKSVPEPAPRKKSLTPCSSSDENGEGSGSNSNSVSNSTPPKNSNFNFGTNKFFPVPKPRVANNTASSGLRTPSSFISRMAADFSSQPPPPPLLSPSPTPNAHSEQPNNGFGSTNGTSAYSNGNGKAGSASPPPPLVSEEPPPRALSVAERMKLLQRANSNSTSDEHEAEKPLEAPREKPSPASAPNPIVKPERKASFKCGPTKSDPISVPQPATGTSVKRTPSLNKRIDTVFGQVSKYRNFKVESLHRKFHLENLRNISPTAPGESEALQANPLRVAVPLNTPGGKLGIYELSSPGRQPDGVIPALVVGSKIMDFAWDPFDNARIAVGTDDGRLSTWIIPPGGLKAPTNEPATSIPAHGEKITLIKFHPTAADILASASYDLSIRIWDLASSAGLYQLSVPSGLLAAAWSPCGRQLATLSKDAKLRVYEPRKSDGATPVLEVVGPAGVRAGRLAWASEGKSLIVSGFERGSERVVALFGADGGRLATIPLDVSPSVLIPFYDEDSSILILYGRGDSTILAFDVSEEAPYLRQVNQHRLPGAHQGMSFLKKVAVDVANVEFAKAYRLTDVVIEPLSFTVPRVKSEYFQDDLFPPTRVNWEPSLSAEDWASGANAEPRRISLKPESMKAVGDIGAGFFSKDKDKSSGHGQAQSHDGHGHSQGGGGDMRQRQPKPSFATRATDPEDEKMAEQLERAIKEKLELNLSLEQDKMEGVDEDEWNE